MELHPVYPVEKGLQAVGWSRGHAEGAQTGLSAHPWDRLGSAQGRTPHAG